MMTPDPILRVRDVATRIGLSRATIYRMENKGQFPRRLQLSPGAVGWRESEVRSWLASLPLASAAAVPC